MAQRKRRARQKEEIEEVEEDGEIEEEEQEDKKSRKGKKKEKGRKKKDAGRDSSIIYRDGEMPRMHGKGVAFSLALTISGALTLILVVFGVVLFIVQSNSLDRQIDSGGTEAVRILASTDPTCWDTLHGTSFEGQEMDIRMGKVKGDMTEDEKGRRKLNLDRLVPLIQGETQILIAMILDRRGGEIKRCSFPGKLETKPMFDSSRTDGDVIISYGSYFLNNVRYSARSYRSPIKDYKGERIGLAEIVLSEDQIDRAKIKMLLTMLILVVIFIGAGIGVAILVGKRIAIPVKALIEDVSIVAKGDLDHHTVPKSQDEIGLLARTFDKMTKNLQEGQHRELELAAQKHQLAVAQEVQAKLLPEVIPQAEGYDIKAHHRGSKEMGGNFYDVIQFPDGKIGAIVASASGKGIPAAMVMTMARSFMRSLTHKGDDLTDMMRECNRLLSPDLRAGMYVEVLMVVLDAARNKARLVCAGRTMLLRFDAKNQKLTAVQAEGIAMGFDKGPVFDKTLKETEVDIQPGDRLFLGAQSLFSIKSPEGGEIGTKGCARLLVKHAAEDSDTFVRRMVTSMDNFAGGEVRDSEITFVTIKRK